MNSLFHLIYHYLCIFLDVKECENDPCLNGGTCVEDGHIPNFRECICGTGYTGLTCETGECKATP